MTILLNARYPFRNACPLVEGLIDVLLIKVASWFHLSLIVARESRQRDACLADKIKGVKTIGERKNTWCL